MMHEELVGVAVAAKGIVLKNWWLDGTASES